MGGVGYYRIFPRDLSKRIRPITSFLRKGVKFKFTPNMEIIVREIIAELATPPILIFPNLHAVGDGSRSFHAYCDACIDGFGAALETGAARRLSAAHRLYQPLYPRFRETLDLARLGSWQHCLGHLTPSRIPSTLEA